jgi:phospholipid/cholesterol/gamma-HCH transport system ATP-binding protein
MTAASILSIRGLGKAYGEKVVLRDVSFDVARGESFVVMGRSGTGKSVLLRHLNRLERPDHGSVLFDGTDLAHLSEEDMAPLRVRLAMLFQGGALFDSMTVYENIAFPLREHRTLSEEEIAERVRRELASVGLPDVESKMPADLSGGMKKRVALARSLVLEPEVLLFDEPTTGLDPVSSASIGRLIKDTQRRRGMTSVVVTHDIPLARAVGDRVALLDDGALRFVGTWQQVDASQDEVLRGFVTGRARAEELVTHG